MDDSVPFFRLSVALHEKNESPLELLDFLSSSLRDIDARSLSHYLRTGRASETEKFDLKVFLYSTWKTSIRRLRNFRRAGAGNSVSPPPPSIAWWWWG